MTAYFHYISKTKWGEIGGKRLKRSQTEVWATRGKKYVACPFPPKADQPLAEGREKVVKGLNGCWRYLEN